MPRSNGIYSPPPGTGGTPQTVISSAMFNAWVADISADQNNPRPIIAGGTGSATSQGAIDAFFGAPRTIVDERLLFVDPADPTKRVRLDAGDVTAGQTRLLVMRDADTDMSELLDRDGGNVGDDTAQANLRSNIGAAPMLWGVEIKSATYAVQLDDAYTHLLMDTDGEDFILPALSGVTEGVPYSLRNTSAGLVVIEADGSDTIEDQVTGTPAGTFSLPPGKAGVLAKMGGVWRWVGPQPSGWTWSSSQSLSGLGAADFTGIPSNASEIILAIDGSSLSGTDGTLVQLGVSGTPVTSGYAATAAVVVTASSSAQTSSAGFPIMSNVAAAVNTGRMHLLRETGNTWLASYSGHYVNGAVVGTVIAGGRVALGGVADMVRLTRSGSNTFDLGSAMVGWR